MKRLRSVALAAVLSLVAGATTASTAVAEPTSPPTTTAGTADVVIGEFEPGTGETWDVHATGSATGSLAIAADAPAHGAGHGRLTASVTSGTLEAARWPGRIDATAVSLSVRTADVDILTVRLQDSTGQAHQQRVTVDPDSEGWQTIRLEDFTSGDGYLHFGGANDGVWHGPLQAFSVILDTWSFRDGTTAGSLDIDSVLAEVEQTTPAIDLGTLVPGNVFQTGDDIAVGIAGDAAEVSWTVLDASGSVAAQGAAATADLGGQLPLEIDAPGWYRLDVIATTADGARHVAGTDLAVLEPLPTDFVRDPRFAVATHYGQSWPLATAALVAEAGFGLGRDEAYWAGQETTPGQILWQDKVVAYQDEFAELGLGHLRVLSYGNPLYFEDEAPSTPEGREAFARYAVATVAELGVEGNYFEVWNEWNWRDLDGAAAGSAEQYVALLEVVHAAVKAEFPDAVLIGPALAPMNDWEGWFREFADLGGLDLVNAVSTHPYTYPGAPEGSSRFQGQYGALSTIMAEHGHAEMPLFLSEIGWPTSETSVGVDEATQARLMLRGHLVALADGVDNITVYDFMDDGTDSSEVEHRFGIVRNTDDDRGAFVPKPAYVTSAVMNRQLAGLAFQTRSDVGDSDVWDLVFADGARTVHAAWALAPTTVAYETAGPVVVTDAYGARTQLSPGADGLVHVALDGEPVYLEGDIAGATTSQVYRLEVDPEIAGAPATGTVVVEGPSADLELEIVPHGGEPVTALVPAGSSRSIAIAYDAQPSSTARRYDALVRAGGVPVALLRTTGRPTPALTLTGTHGVDETGDTLRLTVTNAAGTPVVLDGVDVTIAGQTSQVGEGESVPAGASITRTVAVDVAGPTAWSASAHAENAAPAIASGTLLPVDDPVQVPSLPIAVDGVLDSGLDAFEPHRIGVEDAPAIPGWEGPDDLSASIWLSRDEDGLYVTVQAQDDTHAQPRTGGDIWQGDGIQIGLVAGAPGEDPVPHEIGIALTDTGVVAIHRWAPSDLAGTPVGVAAAVVRDEASDLTTYEVSIPWSTIDVDPEGRLLASTVVLNENDGAGREGWLSWGLGLAETKDASLFNALLLDAHTPDTTRPEVTLTSPSAGGSYQQLQIRVDATDAGGIDRIVANVYRDGVLVRSTQTRADGATAATHAAEVELPDGSYVIRYNAHDVAGNVSRTGEVPVTIDTTAPTVTVKTGPGFTLGDEQGYEVVSFKLFDDGKITGFALNGIERDLVDDRWSDVNMVEPGVLGAVGGENVLEVYDRAGNVRTVTFVLL